MMAPNEMIRFEGSWQAFWDPTTHEPGASLTMHDCLRWVEEEEPHLALEGIGFLLRWLSEREEELVTKAVVEGYSWADIGSYLGRTKQAVWQKYRNREDQSARD